MMQACHEHLPNYIKSPPVREFMSKSTPDLFKKSLIAVAVLSLSACSSTPRIEDSGLSRVGEGIMNAGRTTADVSGRIWNKTTYLLGFSDDDGETVADEGLLMDAEDVALLDGDTAASRDTVVRPIVIRSAIPTRQDQTPINMGQDQTPINMELNDEVQPPVSLDQAAVTGITDSQPSGQVDQTPTNTQLSDASDNESVIKEDLIHEVTHSETLWDIAKKTTGDANNWHILADTNNLGPGASVYPGQELTIPADMVKPDYDTASDMAAPHQAATDLYVDTQNLAGAADQAPTMATQSDVASTAVEQEITGQPFKVNPGETLWDFSKRITGDATNWQTIAGQNNFTDKQASYVRTGQTIFVPENLVKPELGAAPALEKDPGSAQMSLPAAEPESQPALPPTDVAETELQDKKQDELAIRVITSASAASRKSNDPLINNAGTDVLGDTTDLLDQNKPIRIVEATYKSSKSPATLPAEAPTADSAALAVQNTNDQSPAQIMVSGTYYPKAVYNEADFSSSLLMRVSPGTTLQVSKAMGSWYQVKTNKGLGYVHQRDIK